MLKRIKKRRAKGLTNYKKRIALLKGNYIRAVIRKSNRNILVQFVILDEKERSDKIVGSVNSSILKNFGWEPKRNIPTAYLTGLLAAKKFQDKGNEVVLDMGLYKPIKSSIIYAAAKGIVDGGIKLRNNIEVDENRIKGAHISSYAAILKSDEKQYKNKFSSYIKSKFDINKISELFEVAKMKINEAQTNNK
ncbi:MAG: 50S ribosomal protein L18 [Candidatus Marsarchaeota archaeon]|jgi:large subunit ribosomal protein L18|nr:50S ribosomal protein L18 [Candidatus Marsarchaeota archaeon]